jgi:hypothetical protein
MKQIARITAIVGLFLYMGAANATDLFSDAWMKAFGEAWNNEPTIVDPLAETKFNSTICYGYKGEENPKGCLVVKDGKAESAGAYNGEEANWDLRGEADEWDDWIENGIGKGDLMKPGWAGGLKFAKGEYLKMMTSPSMWGPFVKSFAVMATVEVEEAGAEAGAEAGTEASNPDD